MYLLNALCNNTGSNNQYAHIVDRSFRLFVLRWCERSGFLVDVQL